MNRIGSNLHAVVCFVLSMPRSCWLAPYSVDRGWLFSEFRFAFSFCIIVPLIAIGNQRDQ
jgi:hypothetical protein